MLKKQKIIFFLLVSLISLGFVLGGGGKTEAWIEDCYWICDGELLWCGGTICVTSDAARQYYGYTGYGLCSWDGSSGCWPGDLGGHYGWLCRNSCTGAGWCDNVPPPPLGFRCHYISYWYCSGSTPIPVWDSVMNSGCSDAGIISCATNGACGSSNGGTFVSAPTANLCSTGSASAVSGSGPWNWTCYGSGGGSNASCSANISGPAADIKANGSDGPITINYNTAATISWGSTNASSCNVTPAGWTGISNPGLSTGNLTTAITYTQNCTGPGGNASDSVTVNVNTPPPATVTLIPPMATVSLGSSSGLTWATTNAVSCLASSGSGNWPGSKNAAGGNENVTPTTKGNTIYTIQCLNIIGTPSVPANATVCAKDCSCAASTCSGSTCPDGCGGTCPGTLPPNTCGEWGVCNKSCGGGNKTRSCVCPNKTETQACNSQPCPPSYREVTPW